MTDSEPPKNVFDDVKIEKQGEILIDKWKEFGSMDAIKDDLFLFVIEAHGVIEELTTRAICQNIIDDGYSSDAFNYVYSDMSQYHREKLLSQCGILDETLPNSLDNFRGLRNQIAHNRGRNIDWKGDNVEETVREAIDTVAALHEVAYQTE